MNRICMGIAAVCLLLHGAWASSFGVADEFTGREWIDMDYGPYLTASIQVAPGNIAYKGIAIRLDEGEGGVSSGQEFMLFDTDTLRLVAGWTGQQFIDWRNIVFDGSHGTHPSIRGDTVFSNQVGPGWGRPADGSFTDVRLRGRDNLPYGPLPRDWAHWKGLYLHGNRVVLSYTVGEVDVLESPGREQHEATSAMSRTINLGPRPYDLILQVAQNPDAVLTLLESDGADAAEHRLALFAPKAPDAGQSDKPDAKNVLPFDGQNSLEVAGSDRFDFTGADYTIAARIKTTEDGTILAKAPLRGQWAPNGKTLFVRGGRLVFDIGWVGAVRTNRRVDDGRWHRVAMTFHHRSGAVRLYVDGKQAGQGTLKPKAPADGHVVRLGYTSTDFPEQSAFTGAMSKVRVYRRALDAAELATAQGLPDDDSLVAVWSPDADDGQIVRDKPGGVHSAKRQRIGAGGASVQANSATIVAAIGGTAGTQWLTTPDGHLRLKIPASDGPVRLKLLYSPVAAGNDVKPFTALVAASGPATELKPLTAGGPPRWEQKITTQTATLGDDQGPLAVDVLSTPTDNPWRSWIRTGGFDFYPDGRRAAVCTWQGDVWIVDGLGDTPEKLTWRRIATGMFQPLGVKIVDGQIYVCCRDQITRLHDSNGDGEIDFYENFNNDHQVTEHFHEFAMDLQTDAAGNFYFAKSARHALDSLIPHHGTLIRVSPDGRTSAIVCNGFRAANGVGIGPGGELATSDQEGHWTPANRINLVKPGGFYGNMFSYHRGERPKDYLPPVCWLPTRVDRSPAEQLWVPADTWGPLAGKLLSTSYGTGKMWHVMYQRVGEEVQGGVVQLPLPEFPTGIMRGRFHPGDGQLYACGLFGWSSNKTQPGGFYRVRRTSQPLNLPTALEVRSDGIAVTFSDSLDETEASDYFNYNVEQWNYRWTANYGSKHYSVKNPRREGRDEVEVLDATLSADGKTVFLEIEDLAPVMQMEISYTLKAADGTPIQQTIWNTINTLDVGR